MRITLALAAIALMACGGEGSGLVGTIGGGGGGGSNQNPLVATVNITNFAFAPNNARIRPGGSVVWVWNTGDTTSHNVTFSNTTLNSGNRNFGTHTAPFSAAGTFTYVCTLHSGMSGVVTVN